MTEIVPYTYTNPPLEQRRRFSAEWLLDPAELAQRVGATDFVPDSLRGNAAAITAALLFGEEVGLQPMTSLAKIAVINGRPTMAADAQRALILAAGHDLWIEESTVHRCTIAGRRRDSDQVSRVTWTLEDARRANLANRNAWKLYPRQMLLARASAELARAVFPDAIAGLHATEELEDSPELAAIANGPEPQPPQPKTRRRRRTGITAAGAASAPVAATEPEPGPEPAAADTAPQNAPERAEGELPADEQAVLDQLERDFDARPAEPEPEPAPPITEPQRRKLHALFRDKGITDRAERLTYCGAVLDRDVPTSTDMTLDEASTVIDHLEQYDPDNPQTHPLPEGF